MNNATKSIVQPIGPVVLHWFALTAEQAQQSQDRLRASGVRIAAGEKPKYFASVLIDPATQQGVLAQIQQGLAAFKAANAGCEHLPLLKDLTVGKKNLKAGKTDRFPNHIQLSITSNYAPHLFLRDKSAAPPETFYGGCVVGLGVCFRKSLGSTQGITMSIESVQFLNDGTPLGGGGVDPVTAANRLGEFACELPAGAAPAQTPAQTGVYGQPINRTYEGGL